MNHNHFKSLQISVKHVVCRFPFCYSESRSSFPHLFYGKESMHKSTTVNSAHTKEKIPAACQEEDAALKTMMQFFAEELLPYFGITGKVAGFAPTELVQLEIQKFFQDFNLIMQDGSWKHFEFQSTNGGLSDLKRFRVYEAVTSYQNRVPVTTYVLYSGTIRRPMTQFTEGLNTYRIQPILMQDQDADVLFRTLSEKAANGTLNRKDLIPMVLSPLMGGDMPQKERIKNSCLLLKKAGSCMSSDEIHKMEAVIYAMAEKFLESVDLEKLKEEISMTRLGQMLMEEGFSRGIENEKITAARSILDLLSPEIIAERIGLPLEKVLELKAEQDKNRQE